MKFGAMNFPIHPVISEIDRIADLGFDYLELAMDPPAAHYTTLHSDRAKIQNALTRRNLSLICHLPTFVSIGDLTDSIRQASLAEMERSLRVAESLGAVKVVFHPGAVHGMGHFVPDVARAYGLASLDAIYRLAAELSLPLCVENMFPGYGAYYEARDYEVLFKRYPGMQMTLDTGHAHIGATDGGRLKQFVELFASRIDHVHISDNSGRADEHLPPGRGSIDFRWLVKKLKAAGFGATVTFEIFTGNPADLERSRSDFMQWWAA
jgi:sugar phosphate isomerase/epimerase